MHAAARSPAMEPSGISSSSGPLPFRLCERKPQSDRMKAIKMGFNQELLQQKTAFCTQHEQLGFRAEAGRVGLVDEDGRG